MGVNRLAEFICNIADTKKAEDIVVLDMRRATNLCDYFFICSANSVRHAKAIADAITEALNKKKIRPWHIEGYKDGNWIILDYNSVVAHIFYAETRSFYKLERLWGDAPHVIFSKPKPKKKPRCRKTLSMKASPA